VTVGRMDSRERYKGHDHVIAAMPHLVATGHDVVYLVIGARQRSRSTCCRIRTARRACADAWMREAWTPSARRRNSSALRRSAHVLNGIFRLTNETFLVRIKDRSHEALSAPVPDCIGFGEDLL
jgi:hypothetical protein